jgi:hypothetical protein
MNGEVHMGAVSWARRPISRAVAFSRSILACVAESRRWVNLGETESARGRAPGRGAGGFGIVTDARMLSTAPDAFSTIAVAPTSPTASTVIGPSARHVLDVDLTKCSGSPDIVPLIRIALSVDSARRRARRTIAPGAGAAGEIVSV